MAKNPGRQTKPETQYLAKIAKIAKKGK